MPVIEIDHMSRAFGDVRALDSVSLSVQEGTVLGLLGPNGSGKTTLVSILATLQQPDSGTATICGCDVVADAAQVRTLISLTGQSAALDMALTARENLSLFGRLTGLSRREIPARTDELVETYELGEVIDRRVSALSGGMRRRVDIACALVTRPQVLFLDEPTTGLDPRSRQSVWQTVARLRSEGMTVLLTTQYLEEADRLADRIVMLDHGREVASGTPHDLKVLVGEAVCEVILTDPDDRRRLLAALAEVSVVESERVSEVGEQSAAMVCVDAPDGIDTVATVIEAVRVAAVDVVDIGLRRPSLDEVFFRLTESGAQPVGNSR